MSVPSGSVMFCNDCSLFPSDSPLRLDTESALHVGRLLYTETVTVNESIARCTIAHIEVTFTSCEFVNHFAGKIEHCDAIQAPK